MELHKKIIAKVILISLSLSIANALANDNTYATTQISSSECYDAYGQPRVSDCLPSMEEHNLEI